MLLLPCPWCGARSEDEFVYGGDATLEPSPDSSGASDEAWLAYLYLRTNPKGQHMEWWYHETGCGRWFRVVRNTVDHRVCAASAIDGAVGCPEP